MSFSAAVPGFRVVRRADAPPLTAMAVVGTMRVFQHAEQALAVMAVNTDAAAALDPALRRKRRARWRHTAAGDRLTGHDRLARIWEPRSRRCLGGEEHKSQPAGPWLAQQPVDPIVPHRPAQVQLHGGVIVG